jgi:hypothetical protein
VSAHIMIIAFARSYLQKRERYVKVPCSDYMPTLMNCCPLLVLEAQTLDSWQMF